ncbi:MAG: hypothetical protein KH436_03700 [Firmicutes bacterium]|nr:hypothetical protein [Bacillota bacterium]
MKTIGKKSTVLLLVLAILGTCFMSFGWSKREKAQALASDIDTIYYLTDYYPTLSYDALYYEFGDSYEYQYELKALDETILYDMVHTGFFADLAENHLVIIDIKLLKPDVDVLSDLFFDLKVMQGCMTVFVSSYAASAYANTEFLDYVDLFIVDADWEGLTEYVNFAFNKITDRVDNLDEDLSNAAFLIDGNMMGTGSYYYSAGLDVVCAESRFLGGFMELYVDYLSTSRDDFYINDYNDLTDLFDDLNSAPNNNFNVRFLVHAGNYYIDLLTGNTVNYNSLSYVLGWDIGEPCYLYGFGVMPLTPAFYQFMTTCQQSYNCPVYTLACGPVNYGPNGLVVTMADGSTGSAAGALLNGLYELLGWV